MTLRNCGIALLTFSRRDRLFDRSRPVGNDKALPNEQSRIFWSIYRPEEPEYRNIAAFGFVVSKLKMRIAWNALKQLIGLS